MENFMNDISKDFDELIDLIKDSEIYKEYKKLELKVKKNKDINRLVSIIKKLQKEAVNAEHKKNYDLLEQKNKEISSKNIELNNVPLYNDYVDKMNELNELLVTIKNKFDLFIKELTLR